MQNLQTKAQIYKLFWEEETFGIKAAKLNLESELTEEVWSNLKKKIKEYDMVVLNNYGNNSKNNLLISQLDNCYVSDINVQFQKKVSNISKSKNYKIKITNNKEIDEDILEIAKKSFIYSRFYNDPNLDNKKAKCIYVDWTRNSFNKENKYFVTYQENNKIIGFLIFSIDKNIATIELVAVDKKYQNKNIGKDIINEFERFLFKFKNNVTLINVGTQSENKKAIKFYQNLGFKLINIYTIYNKWNNKDN